LFTYLCIDVICSKYPHIYQTNPSVYVKHTRQQNKLLIPLVRLYSIQRGVYYSSVKILNQLPQNIFKFHHIHIFKTSLWVYPVKNAFYSIEEFFSTDHDSQLAINILDLCSVFELYFISQYRYMNIQIHILFHCFVMHVAFNYCVLIVFSMLFTTFLLISCNFVTYCFDFIDWLIDWFIVLPRDPYTGTLQWILEQSRERSVT